jgi:O-antigen ligase
MALYGVFLCSYFVFPEYSQPYRFFARVVFVLGIFVTVGGIRATWRHPVFRAMAVYMIYLLLSAFWSDPFDWFLLGQKVTISIYLLGFIAITHYLVHWNRDFFERMLQLCILVAAVAASISIAVFYSENPFPATRLIGIGSLTNINEFSVVYGIFALLAASFVLRRPGFPIQALFLSAIGVFICFAWFGQSRTTLVALVIALCALTGLTLNEKKLLFLAALVILIAALFFIFPDSVEGAWIRGWGLRAQIWAQIWSEAYSAPIAGHGLISQLSVDAGGKVFENAHSAYLQVFWQGGVIGFSLFIFLLITAMRHAWSQGHQEGGYTVFCMLVFAAITMTTDLDTLIARPREQWMLFWFPLALLLSYPSITPRSQRHSALSTHEKRNS